MTANKGAGQFNYDPGINVLGWLDYGAPNDTPTIPWSGTGRPHEAAKFATNRPLEIVHDPTDFLDPADGVRKSSSFAFRVMRRNEGFRFQVSPTGEIQVNDGVGWSPKARWTLEGNATDGWAWGTGNIVNLNNGLTLKEIGTTPPIPTNGNRAAIYVRGDKLVVAFKDAGGAMKHRYMSLSDTTATWTYTTTAPT